MNQCVTRKKLAVLASGRGTTLQTIIDAIDSKQLDAEIAVVISNVPTAYAAQRAIKAGISTCMVGNKPKDELLSQLLSDYGVELVVLDDYQQMIGPEVLKKHIVINSHPALIPSQYFGKGMYGMHVHESIIKNHEIITGVTVYFVDEHYDYRGIISKTVIPVFSTDTVDDVAKKVQKVERTQLIRVLDQFSKGQISC